MLSIASIAAMLGLVSAGNQVGKSLNGEPVMLNEPEPQQPVVPPIQRDREPEKDQWDEFAARDFFGTGESLAAAGPNPNTYKSALERIEAEAETILEKVLEKQRKALAVLESQFVRQRNLPEFSADAFEVQKKELQRLVDLTQKHVEGVSKHEGPFKSIFRQFHDGFQRGVEQFNRENDFLNNL